MIDTAEAKLKDVERTEGMLESAIAEAKESVATLKEEIAASINYAKNNEELTRRQNDLDVFQFILTFQMQPLCCLIMCSPDPTDSGLLHDKLSLM